MKLDGQKSAEQAAGLGVILQGIMAEIFLRSREIFSTRARKSVYSKSQLPSRPMERQIDFD